MIKSLLKSSERNQIENHLREWKWNKIMIFDEKSTDLESEGKILSIFFVKIYQIVWINEVQF